MLADDAFVKGGVSPLLVLNEDEDGGVRGLPLDDKDLETPALVWPILRGK